MVCPWLPRCRAGGGDAGIYCYLSPGLVSTGCLAAIDRLHGDPGLELGALSLALAHCWESFQGRSAASEVNDGGFPEKLVHLKKLPSREARQFLELLK